MMDHNILTLRTAVDGCWVARKEISFGVLLHAPLLLRPMSIHRRGALSCLFLSSFAKKKMTTPLSTTCTPFTSQPSVPKFFIHSTFRDPASGRQLLPDGLEWGLPGESIMAYVPMQVGDGGDDDHGGEKQLVPSPGESVIGPNSMAVRLGILHAHNRWLFAKDLPLKRLDDIVKVSADKQGPHNTYYFRVQWKDGCHVESKIYHETNVAEFFLQQLEKVSAASLGSKKRVLATSNIVTENDSSAGGATNSTTSAVHQSSGLRPPPQVWINGNYHGILTPDSVPRVLQAVQECASRKLCFKTSTTDSDDGQPELWMIRVDRYFRGGLYHRDEVFDHTMDNLIALEDPKILDDKTLIGTATLPDWIMGGMLTSRLYVEELDNGNVLFLRPLYADNIETSDRRFKLIRGGPDDPKIAQVRRELKRLRYLAELPDPHYYRHHHRDDNRKYEDGSAATAAAAAVLSSDETVESARSRQHRRNRRKFFGM